MENGETMRRIGFYIIVAVVFAGVIAASPAARAQLLPGVTGPVRDLANETLRDQRLKEMAERRARQAAEEAEALAEESADAGAGVAEGAADVAIQAVGSASEVAGNVVRSFMPATDPAGFEIEATTIVALVSVDEVAQLEAAGYAVVAARPLPSLGRTMVTLRTPAGSDLAAHVDTLRQALPTAAVDYNHLYRWDTDAPADTPAVMPPAGVAAETARSEDDSRLRIGVIDSAVQASHRALEGVDVHAADFIAHEGERIETHGTAVASLVTRSAGNDVAIYSASVFFQVPGHAPGASTESIVAALDWLAGQGVQVINMSLSGPGNSLLEAAVAALVEQGQVIVAAVGNDGPSSPPLYPAAYDGVIGVTAVDRNRRVFRAANRGDYVDFAALGVDVKVADCTTGSYRLASGTSMATPHVAVVAAKLLLQSGAEPALLESWLVAGAEDLGRKGFDTTYGYGLVTRTPVVTAAGHR